MALQHVGRPYVLSMDLENFFESITPLHVQHALDAPVIDLCFIGGVLRQGLPTSPVIANIAFLAFDEAIVAALKRLKIDAVYTRYADDLVFSFSDGFIAGKIATVVKQIVERGGFKVSERKTRIQSARNGRVVVVGIALDARGLHPTRKTKKKIRAALHQGNTSAVKGLSEWAKCNLPRAITCPLSTAPA